MKGHIERIGLIYFITVILALVVVARIIYLQYFAELSVTDVDIVFRTEEIEAMRGSILAADGRSLASSVPFYKIRMDCIFPEESYFNETIDSLAISLSKFFGNKSAREYKNEIIAARKSGNRYKTIGNRLVDYSEMVTIKNFPMFRGKNNKGGFISEQINRRNNPYGRLAYRTIGFINTNGVGVGIEGSYDFYLKGTPGSQRLQRLLGGEWMPVSEEERVTPLDGLDIRTTIDVEIQEAAEEALRKQLSLSDVFEGATAIVMEVKSGAVRAITNMKKMSNGKFDESYNYAIGEATEPGSTFKLATLVALIEDGYVTLDTPIDAGNGKWSYSKKVFSDVSSGGYGLIDVRTAFEKSSNVAFAKLAVEFYSNNEKKYIDRLHNMKIGEKFNLDIVGEGRSVIHTPGDQMWNKLTLPMMAMGYASLLTPLHTLTFYNAIANNGKMMKPYFVEGFERHGQIEKQFSPQEVSGSICSKNTIKLVHEALRGVVENGTAKNINDSRYKISGKTGTAQIAFDGRYIDAGGYRKHQASFAGFFPSDNPQYSVIVVLYTNKTRGNFYGGSWAAPVFKQIADKIYINRPEWNRPLDTKSIKTTEKPHTFLTHNQFTEVPDSIPNVLNMGLRDAIYILENRGIRVSYAGRGKVIKQIPAPNTPSEGIGNIYLILSQVHETEGSIKEDRDS